MEVKEQPRAYWSDCGQVFFCDGKGYGLTTALQTICLGAEVDILEAFSTGKLPDCLNSLQHQVLTAILDYRKEVLHNARAIETKRPGTIRSRPDGAAEHRTVGVRQSPARKGLPLRQAKR